VHAALRNFTLGGRGSALDARGRSVRALQELEGQAVVVGVTALGVKHSMFRRRRFDFCVVDEASQITEPVVLAPLRCCGAFVLVGDHHQLAPLVRNAVAREAGMGTSLFKRLADAHPQAVAELQVLVHLKCTPSPCLLLAQSVTRSRPPPPPARAAPAD
jgi:DNA replication ATP-dependent helicase Dna2